MNQYINYTNNHRENKIVCLETNDDFINFMYTETKEKDQIFYKNKLDPKLNFYYKQNIYSYWIYSSHNTYLPYGQIFDKCDTIYYKLQTFLLSGGCLEIDIISVCDDDVIVYHLATNSNSIKLSDIFKVVVSAVKEKERKKIISGPIILTIDNKNLTTLEEYKVFISVAKKYFYENNILFEINNSYDLRKIPISSISSNVIIRWGGKTEIIDLKNNNNNNNDDINSNNNQTSSENSKTSSPRILYELTEILDLEDCDIGDNNNLTTQISFRDKNWVHIKKSNNKYYYDKEIIQESNLTFSNSATFLKSSININLNIILNSQKNMMKIFPHFLNMRSGNYDNTEYFRNGIQLVSINIQSISDPWHINNSLFMPSTGKPCSLNEFTSQNNITSEKGTRWKNSLNNSELTAYRLKPLWLLGLSEYPELYNLKLTLISIKKINSEGNIENDTVDYKKIKFTYNLTDEKYELYGVGNSIIITDIDVTTPFFIVKLTKNNSFYKTGIFIDWDLYNPEGTFTFDINKLNQTSSSYNTIKLSNEEGTDDSSIYNVNKQIRIKLCYKWEKSTSEKNKNHTDNIIKYNTNINKLRTSGKYVLKNIQNFLDDINLFNEFQDELSSLML
jgi:hypothetical protein